MGACEQICLPAAQGFFTCACATGFKLNTDNRTCAPFQSYVVISTLSAIKGFSLEGGDHSEAMVPVAGRGQSFSGLALCVVVEVAVTPDVLLQAVMPYTSMYIWLLGLSTGVTSAAQWQLKTGSGGSSQMALDYVV